jgi:hypothetical protein
MLATHYLPFLHRQLRLLSTSSTKIDDWSSRRSANQYSEESDSSSTIVPIAFENDMFGKAQGMHIALSHIDAKGLQQDASSRKHILTQCSFENRVDIRK